MKEKKQQNKTGSLLITVLGLFIMLIVLFGALSSMALRTTKTTIKDIEREQAYLYAKSVLQPIVEEIIKSSTSFKLEDFVPATTKVMIQTSKGNQEVSIAIKKEADIVTFTTTAIINEQKGTLSASFKMVSGSGYGELVGIIGNQDLFKQVIYANKKSRYWEYILDVSGATIIGDIHTNAIMKIGNGTSITGVVDADNLTLSSNANGNSPMMVGNVYVRNRVNDSGSGVINNIYLKGNLMANFAGGDWYSLDINKSVVVGNVYTAGKAIDINNSVIDGSFINIHNEQSTLSIVNSVIYKDLLVKYSGITYPKNNKKSYMGGKSSVAPAELYAHQNLVTVTDGKYFNILNDATKACVGTCSTTRVPISVFDLTVPSYPNKPQMTSIRIPTTYGIEVTLNCSSDKCSGFKAFENNSIIDASSQPMYVRVKGLPGSGWSEVFVNFSPSEYVVGDKSVYFIFDQEVDGRSIIFSKKFGYVSDRLGKTNQYLIFNSSDLGFIELNNNFNGYVYAPNKVIRVRSNLIGAVSGDHIQICSPYINKNDCSIGSGSITYVAPSSGSTDSIIFNGYK